MDWPRNDYAIGNVPGSVITKKSVPSIETSAARRPLLFTSPKADKLTCTGWKEEQLLAAQYRAQLSVDERCCPGSIDSLATRRSSPSKV